MVNNCEKTLAMQMHDKILRAHKVAIDLDYACGTKLGIGYAFPVFGILGALTISPVGAVLSIAQTVVSIALAAGFGVASICQPRNEKLKERAYTAFIDAGNAAWTATCCAVNTVTLGILLKALLVVVPLLEKAIDEELEKRAQASAAARAA